jgi:catechol 2,3-dioxygenase-like lactoylglutathione lyase family enzyme
MSLMSDAVNIIIFPAQHARQANPEHWKGRTELASSKGRAIDQVGFSVDNLSETLERMRKDGVKVTDEPKTALGGKLKYAFIEGPDKIRIEVVEDHTNR